MDFSIKNKIRQGADDKFVTLVVKMVCGKISAFSRPVSVSAWIEGLVRYQLPKRRHRAIHHFHYKDVLTI